MRGTNTALLPKLAADFIIEIIVFRAGWGVESLGLALIPSCSSCHWHGGFVWQIKSWGLMKSHFFVGCEGWNGVSCPGRGDLGAEEGDLGAGPSCPSAHGVDPCTCGCAKGKGGFPAEGHGC